MDPARWKMVAAKARELASSVVGKPSSDLGSWALDLRGLMEAYFPGGQLVPELRDAIQDVKQLGEFVRVSEWLTDRTKTMPVPLAPNARDRLNQVAAVIEGVAASAATDPAGPRAQGFDPGTTPRLGRWLLIGDRLGRGGQGDVTLVREERTLERGALKRMTGKRALTDKGRERFVREMEAFQRIEHPFVLRILDAEDSPEPFLVTAVAEFGSLADNIDAFRGDIWRVLRTTRCIALGLGVAHAQGIIHRDIKPKNILLHSLDHPLVADFGIAHFADKDSLTSVGSHPGAFKFAPQEYEFDEQPTPAFDVFSLGAVLHFSITGAEPTRPYRLLSEPPLVADGGSEGTLSVVRELIARMTQREKEARLQTMAEVVAAIDDALDRLYGRPPGGKMGCACESGAFFDVGAVKLGSGTELTVYPDGRGNAGAIGLASLSPRLEMCSGCGVLRMRALNPKRARQ